MNLDPQPNPASNPNPTPDPSTLSGASLPRAGTISEVDDASFDAEVLKSQDPVLVDFFTPSCGPCRRLMPVLNEIAKDFAADIKVVKVNVADNYQTAIDQNVNRVPTLKLFRGGQVVMELSGLMSKDALAQEIRKALA